MLTRKVKLIPPGRRNRPVTFKSSSRYNVKIKPKYLTVHNDNSTALGLSKYILGDSAANRPASWHDSVDDKDWFNHIPYDENAWHAGDNLGPGNLTTLGMEICYGSGVDYEKAELNGAWVAAQHILTIPSLLQYPECLRQHWHWSGKNCPIKIRSRSNGWQEFIDKVGSFLVEDTGYNYLIISGSYSTFNNADNQATKLVLSGFDPQIVPIIVNNQAFYRVLVGERDNLFEANVVKDLVIRSGFPATIITVKVEDTLPDIPVDPEQPSGDYRIETIAKLQVVTQDIKKIIESLEKYE